VPDDAFMVIRSFGDIPPGTSIGRRVVVTGRAGAGKSTFSRALSAKTGIPVMHLDELGILLRHVNHVALYVLRSKGAAHHFSST